MIGGGGMEQAIMAAEKGTKKSHEIVSVYIMGKKYDVPSQLTIQKAMEYAGYQLIRGCGCRGGICGACATVYRFPGDYRIQVGLACQTIVKPDMYIAQIPFFPANKAIYAIEKLEATGDTLASFYPEIFKCFGCNTCTKSCPMDIDVMEYMSQAIRGDVARVAELSFDCVMCGLCSARCPAEQVQYQVSILCRRLYGRYLAPSPAHLDEAVTAVKEGRFERQLRELMTKGVNEFKKLYTDRAVEPDMAEESWKPPKREDLPSAEY